MSGLTKWLIFFTALGFSMIIAVTFRVRPYESVLKSQPAPLPTPDATQSMRSLDEIKEAFLTQKDRFVKPPSKILLTEKPYLKGKVVFYSKDIVFGKKDADWFWNDNPRAFSNLIAETPEEVKTVVLRNCNQRKGSDYDLPIKRGQGSKRKIPSFYWKCELVIIDHTIPAVIYRKEFSSQPGITIWLENPEIDKYEMDIPHPKIKSFLDGLPRR